MFTFLVTFLGVFVLYLLLVWGSGDADTAYWAIDEVVAGLILSLISAGVARAILGKADNTKMFLKWPLFLVYVPTVFFFNLAKANIDVAYRVLTGRIKLDIQTCRMCLNIYAIALLESRGHDIQLNVGKIGDTCTHG